MDTFSPIRFHTQLPDTPVEVRQKAVLAVRLFRAGFAAITASNNHRKE